MTLSLPQLILTSSVVLITFSLLKALIGGLQNRLASVPGPWFTRFTGLPTLYHDMTGNQLHWYKSLHLRYGPIVRVSPEEVSVSKADAFHQVHQTGSGFTKGPAFEKLQPGPVPSVFTMREPKVHAERRKVMMRGLTLTSLRKNWAGRIRQQVELAVAKIKHEAENGCVDIYHWWRLMAADTIAQMTFGESFGMLESGQKTDYTIALENMSGHLLLQRVLPFVSLLARLPLPRVRAAFQGTKIIYDYGTEAVENLKAGHSDRQSIFSNILADAEIRKEGSLSDDAIRTEVAVMQIAGSDPMAVALTYAVWAMLKHTDIQQRLEAEVAGLKSDFSVEDLESLTVLNNVIDETLRLYSPAASTTKRLVPPTGTTIEGYYLPKGSYVVTLPWLTYRQHDIFPDPERFDDTRFNKLTQEQKHAFTPFSIGPRSCIGMQLSKMVLRFSLAILFRDCRGLRLDRTMTDGMMDQYAAFLITPKGGKCSVTLRYD